jgi:Leucine-rich repeat (LRR) protein
MSALEGLYLWNNSFMGFLPSCLGYLSHLYDLELKKNQLSGPIPEQLCQVRRLEYLTLYDNALTGTIPSCLGSLDHLEQLKLSSNHFRGTLPVNLCQATALKLLWLNDNTLTGGFPSCLASSFPFLEAILLHDNDLTGSLPSEWTLPSLISIVLSNNPKLSGTLPTRLFLQPPAANMSGNNDSPNIVLRAVVIEGTSIGGTLPAALCSAPQLQTLSFSGNALTGSLPDCITTLQNLHTLRISNNHLDGTLSVAIDNMTSLTVLDLSSNEIQGRVPAGLGNISPNLKTMQLQLNRLSCDLPAAVIDWRKSSANISFNLLGGKSLRLRYKIFQWNHDSVDPRR